MRKIVLFVSLMASSFLALSQDPKTPVKLGFYNALNISTRAANFEDEAKSLVGYGFGGLLKIKTSKDLGLVIRIGLDHQGWAFKNLTFLNPPNLVDGDVFYDLTYVNFAVMPEYETAGRIKFIVSAGPYLGLLAKQRVKIKYDNPPPGEDDEQTFDGDDNLKKGNWGLTAHTGVLFPIGDRIALDLGVRYLLGLSNIYPESPSGDEKTMTRTFSVLLGLRFDLK